MNYKIIYLQPVRLFLNLYCTAEWTKQCRCAIYLQVGLYDVQGRVPIVHRVALVEDESGSPVAVDLQDALPLDALLAPVASCKEAIASALDTLQPEAPLPSSSLSPHEEEDGKPQSIHRDGGRGFGGALQVICEPIAAIIYGVCCLLDCLLAC